MITMLDIAERAGVSRSTVSFVLNERETGVRISEETRQRILAVAHEMGYRRNALARVVATGRNPVLAFMAPYALGTWARYLVGMSEAAEAEGHFVKIVMGRYLPDYSGVQSEAINSCVELRVSGVVAHTLNEKALENLRQSLLPYRIPVAVLGNPLPLPWGISVHADYAQGCRLAVGHLHGLGHRRIAMIGGNRAEGVGHVFEDALDEALREHGLSLHPSHRHESHWKPEGAEAAVRAMFSRTSSQSMVPTAICCISDEVAMVAMRTVRALGLNVPHDVSVVGWLDAGAAEYADPALTSVAEPLEEMGRRLVQLLLARNAAQLALEQAPQQEAPVAPARNARAKRSDASAFEFEDSPQRKALPMELMTRDSTAPPAK